MEGKEYIETVKSYFNFLTTEHGFQVLNEKIRGNAFYDVEFEDSTRIISVSYENIADYFRVIIFLLENSELPDYDDKTKTLHLSQLNAEIIPRIGKTEIAANDEYFQKYKTESEFKKLLLKSAKELRLCMKYLDHQSNKTV